MEEILVLEKIGLVERDSKYITLSKAGTDVYEIDHYIKRSILEPISEDLLEITGEDKQNNVQENYLTVLQKMTS